MSILSRAKQSPKSLLKAFGWDQFLQRLATYWDQKKFDEVVLPIEAAQVSKPDAKEKLGLLRCDVKKQLHAPNNVTSIYGTDTSGTIQYRFNSAGYRSEELDPKASFRILLIGESHAVGNGLAIEDTLGQRFKVHLAQALDWPVDSINLVNLSVGGASADYCARTMIRQVDGVAPDLTICVFPRPDRIEDYSEDFGKFYLASNVKIDEIENLPIPWQGYIDLYSKAFGFMNFAKNALLFQSVCRLRGLEYMMVSEQLRKTNFQTPILKSMFDELIESRIVLHRHFQVRQDKAADGGHAGPMSHEVVAIRMLARFAAILKSKGQQEQSEKLSVYVKQLKSPSEAWAFIKKSQRVRVTQEVAHE